MKNTPPPKKKINSSKLSPLYRGGNPSFEQTWIVFTQWYFVSSKVKIGPVVLEKKKMKMWRVYNDNDRQGTYLDQIRKAHLKLTLRWANKRISVKRITFRIFNTAFCQKKIMIISTISFTFFFKIIKSSCAPIWSILLALMISTLLFWQETL